MACARLNSGLDTDASDVTQNQARGVQDDDIDDDDDAIDDDDDDDDYVPPLVKDVDSDSDDESDDEADGGVPLFPTSEDEDTPDERDNPPSQETNPQISPRRGARVRKPRERFIPTMSGQHHDQGVYPGINFPQVNKMTGFPEL